MKKTEKTIKLYPIYHAFTADLVFFIPIDTLFLSHVKNLSASKITFMNMFGLLVCIIFQKPVVKIAKKLGNLLSVRLGIVLLFISTLFLTFSNNIYGLLVYRLISEISVMFTSMFHIMIKHNLMAISRSDDFVKTMNMGNILYAIVTTITTLIGGYIYNFNNYFPLYITLALLLGMFFVTYSFEEDEDVSDEILESDGSDFKKSKELIWILIASSLFVAMYRIGQTNSKLFLQYDLEDSLSLDKVTIYMTYIMFISRIVRVTACALFTKMYRIFKLQIGNIMAVIHFISFVLMLIGHFSNIFILKVILISLGYFLILVVRDPYQTYAEDLILRNTPKKNQQQMIVKMEAYRKFVQLVLNLSMTLVLLKYELVVTQFIFLVLTFIEIFLHIKMVNTLKQKDA